MRFRHLIFSGSVLGLLLAGAAMATEIVTSQRGHSFTFLSVNVTQERGAMTYHYQFLWPEITQVNLGEKMLETEAETMFLCTEIIKQNGGISGDWARIGITLTDRPVDFGVATPDAKQVFESYAVTSGSCEWEAF